MILCVCDMTHSYMWRDSFIYETWHTWMSHVIYMNGSCHRWMSHDTHWDCHLGLPWWSCMCVTWLTHTRDVTVTHRSIIQVGTHSHSLGVNLPPNSPRSASAIARRGSSFIYLRSPIQVVVRSHSLGVNLPPKSPRSAIAGRGGYIFEITHSNIWRDSFVYTMWLNIYTKPLSQHIYEIDVTQYIGR